MYFCENTNFYETNAIYLLNIFLKKTLITQCVHTDIAGPTGYY